MLLSDVRQFLLTAGISPVYLGELPDPPEFAPSLAVLLAEYSGEQPLWVQPQVSVDQTLNPGSPSYERPRLQVKVRGNTEDYQSGETLVWQVFTAISRIINAVLDSGTFYQRIAPLQSPFFLSRDQNRRPFFAFNCEVFKALG